ncbi:MAG: hypothetical protein ACRDQ5_08865, partial [Sciscionella sp.]
THQLDDAKAEARRWVERLGWQVMNLTGTDDASKQAIADASERYTAAGSQLDQVRTTEQAKLVTQTAMEGLYYVRAARTAMGIDPGPELPDLSGQRNAGTVTEDRRVNVQGEDFEVSPNPGGNTPHYYPGGSVGGRPVPQGWYSRPWWKTALIGGAGAIGGLMIADALFSGMHGVPMDAYGGGYGDGFGDGGFDGGDGGGFDGGGFDGGDGGGFDGGGFDGGGFDGGGDFGDFGGFGDF